MSGQQGKDFGASEARVSAGEQPATAPGGSCPICGNDLKAGEMLALLPDAFGDWVLYHLRSSKRDAGSVNPIAGTPPMSSWCAAAGWTVVRKGGLS